MFGVSDNSCDEDRHAYLRERMVSDQLIRRGIRNKDVVHAMRTVPRHRFIPNRLVGEAYNDAPVPIGVGQTISQPFVVGSMTEHLALEPNDKVLEVGTGCGYQTAVLAEISRRVFSLEVLPELYDRAVAILRELRYDGVSLKLGDGSLGWPTEAPFDAIIITAAAPRVPDLLVDQLAPGGRMVYPLEIAPGRQELIKLTNSPDGLHEEHLYEVRFVPMRGEIERP